MALIIKQKSSWFKSPLPSLSHTDQRRNIMMPDRVVDSDIISRPSCMLDRHYSSMIDISIEESRDAWQGC